MFKSHLISKYETKSCVKNIKTSITIFVMLKKSFCSETKRRFTLNFFGVGSTIGDLHELLSFMLALRIVFTLLIITVEMNINKNI